MFLLEFSANPEPAPLYDHDETGIVVRGESTYPEGNRVLVIVMLTHPLEGEMILDDNEGNKALLYPGDTFFIHRGSSITFSTPRYALAYKVAARHAML